MLFAPMAVAVCAGMPAPADVVFDPWTTEAQYELTYRVDSSSLIGGGGPTRLWIPLPRTDAYQQLVRYDVNAPVGFVERADDRGNRMVYLLLDPAAGRAADVTLHLLVVRRVARVSPLGTAFSGPDDPSNYLAATRRIPLDGAVGAIGTRVAFGVTDPSKRIRVFYDYVVSHMRYSKEGIGWGQGDAARACNVKSGNCTDFHSLLIGLLRSQGIPARFSIGFPAPADVASGSITGYHCWAELFDKATGWIPVDASEAFKSGRRNAYFGTLPSDRIAFTVGRDLTLNPPQAGEPLNFFVYPYAERDGHAVVDVAWTLEFKRLTAKRPQS